jgi:hypothetical protein
MTSPLVDLFSDFSPATDEEIAQISQDVILPEDKPPLGWPFYTNPRGSNRMPLVVNFVERLKYEIAPYFTRDNLPTPMDLYYNKNYYGRVDRFQNAIVPRMNNSFYKQIAQENVFSFNFMADAFFKFRRNMKIAADIGAIEKYQTNLGQPIGVAAWRPYHDRYTAQGQNLHRNFLEHIYLLEGKRFNKIINFETYMKEFRNYLATGKYKLPITLTAMILSPTTNLLTTGLAIEIASENYSRDAVKYHKYIADINFSYYARAARKFGFYVDRNGPWRLIADVFSPPMLNEDGEKGFLVHYGINENTFFDTYYQRTYTLDLRLLITQLIDSYNQFAIQSPRIVESIPGTVKCPAPSYSLIGIRQPITEDFALTPLYWLDLYFTIRSMETGVEYKNKKQLLKRARDIGLAYNWRQAVIFVNNLFKPYLYDERIFRTLSLTKKSDTVRIGASYDSQGTSAGNY